MISTHFTVLVIYGVIMHHNMNILRTISYTCIYIHMFTYILCTILLLYKKSISYFSIGKNYWYSPSNYIVIEQRSKSATSIIYVTLRVYYLHQVIIVMIYFKNWNFYLKKLMHVYDIKSYENQSPPDEKNTDLRWIWNWFIDVWVLLILFFFSKWHLIFVHKLIVAVWLYYAYTGCFRKHATTFNLY